MSFHSGRATHRPYPVRRFSPYPPQSFTPRAPLPQTLRPTVPRSVAPSRAAQRKDVRHPYLELSGFLHKFSFSQVERPIADLAKRYPRRQFPQELLRVTSRWSALSRNEIDIPLNQHVAFHIDPNNAIAETEPVECSPEVSGDVRTRHFVRVMLFNGAKEEDPRKVKFHLSKRLSFLVLRREQQGTAPGFVAPIGAEWSNVLDGAEPNEQSFRRTAARAALASVGVDLSDCLQWTTFAEFWYSRSPTERTHTVVLLPHIWRSHPNGITPHTLIKETYIETHEEQEEVGEDGQKTRRRVPVRREIKSILFRPHEMTLFQLLEYDARPPRTPDESFEMVLFADLFDEMLQRDFGEEVLAVLMAKAAEAASEQRKRSPEDDSLDAKRQRTEGGQNSGEEKPQPQTRTRVVHHVDPKTLFAFQYFDRPTTGQLVDNIKRERLAGLLHSIGDFTIRQVDQLLASANLRIPAKAGVPVPPLYYTKLATFMEEIAEEETPAPTSEEQPAESSPDLNVKLVDPEPFGEREGDTDWIGSAQDL